MLEILLLCVTALCQITPMDGGYLIKTYRYQGSDGSAGSERLDLAQIFFRAADDTLTKCRITHSYKKISGVGAYYTGWDCEAAIAAQEADDG